MIVSNNLSPLWLSLPEDHRDRLTQAVDRGLSQARDGRAVVFFRADDVAVPGKAFTAMAEAFRKADAPLNMAVVPSWLTVSRWEALRRATDGGDLFCWCQHGWRHMNFEAPGVKKREFGQARPARDKRLDLSKGFKRLGDILGPDFTPVFSPPWNRCDGDSLAAMPAIGFRGISRTVGAGPEPPEGLADFPVCMDLHTRKEASPEVSLTNMLEELTSGLASGLCGVMLHHQRMNEAAFSFLSGLLAELGGRPSVGLAHFGNLLGGW
jgi:peptidoglycan/xylan/chitin deacetylase (PgdA/CDA1 family)